MYSVSSCSVFFVFCLVNFDVLSKGVNIALLHREMYSDPVQHNRKATARIHGNNTNVNKATARMQQCQSTTAHFRRGTIGICVNLSIHVAIFRFYGNA